MQTYSCKENSAGYWVANEKLCQEILQLAFQENYLTKSRDQNSESFRVNRTPYTVIVCLFLVQLPGSEDDLVVFGTTITSSRTGSPVKHLIMFLACAGGALPFSTQFSILNIACWYHRSNKLTRQAAGTPGLNLPPLPQKLRRPRKP